MVSVKHLESTVRLLNIRTGSPENYNTGHYFIEASNGGYKVERVTVDGCTQEISQRGSKREIYFFLQAVLLGMELAK